MNVICLKRSRGAGTARRGGADADAGVGADGRISDTVQSAHLNSLPSNCYSVSMTATPDFELHGTAVNLTLAVSQLVRRLRAETNSSGLTLSQLSAMARIERDGPTTTADLARAESMKPQSMGAVLASLEQQGFVLRQAHPTDGRQILFALTPLGAKERSRRDTAKRQWIEAALSRLSPEEREALVAAIPLIKRLGDS